MSRASTSSTSIPDARSDHPLNWAANSGAARDVLVAVEKALKARKRKRRRIATLTGLVAIALFVSQIPWARFHFGDSAPVSRSAIVSLPERNTLSDGSVIEYRSGADVQVAFTQDERRVQLVKGEAHFAVKSDPQRPFIVSVGQIGFRAVGTAFVVRRGPHDSELIVTEGKVAVVDVEGKPLTYVTAGGRVSVAHGANPAPVATLISDAELNARLAWRAPKLEFSATPLGEAVQLINLYSAGRENVRVTLADPALAKVQLSGVLRADNVETLLSLLEIDHGIVVERKSPGEIVLHSAR